jgi:hypothetical protein
MRKIQRIEWINLRMPIHPFKCRHKNTDAQIGNTIYN